MADTLLDVYRSIGEDRYISASELPAESGAFGRTAWEIYDRHFGRFTGAGLDPQFSRFDRAGVRFGRPAFPTARPVIVISGPAIGDDDVSMLQGRRTEVVVLTDPYGAALLQDRGVNPDVVFLEQPRACSSPARHEVDLGPGTVCLVDPAAPVRAFERRGVTRRLARGWPSWGTWPATAVATAIAGGATRVGVLGLPPGGTARAPRADEADEALLTLLARIPGVHFFDLQRTATRPGWEAAGWDALPRRTATDELRVDWEDEGACESVLACAARDLACLSPILPDAQRALQLAQRARAGASVHARDLTRTIETVLAWGCDPCLRFTLQRALGLTYLPRLWRTGISMAAPDRLWRPLMLALRELDDQARRLEGRVRGRLRSTRPSCSSPAPAVGQSYGIPQTSTEGGRHADGARVTVVVPVVERHEHLEDAVGSLMAQTYANLEVLVVYAAPHFDSCAGLGDMRDARLRLLECAGGLARAMNAGVGAATGSLIALHGADDLSHPQRIARQVAYLQAHADVAVVATATRLMDSDGFPLPAAEDACGRVDAWTPEAIGRQLLFGRCFDPGSVLARRSAIEWAGGYRARCASPPDQDLWLRLLPTMRFAMLPTRLHTRRVALVSSGA